MDKKAMNSMLGRAKKNLKGAKKEARDPKFKDKPDSLYLCSLFNCELTETKPKKDKVPEPMIVMEWVIEDGEYNTQHIWMYRTLLTAGAQKMLEGDLMKLETELPDDLTIDALQDVVDYLNSIKVRARIKLKTTSSPGYDDRQWINLQKVLDIEPLGSEKKSKPSKKETSNDNSGEEVDLKIGMTIGFQRENKSFEGKLIEKDDDEETATIESNGKNYAVPYQKLELV